MAQISFADVSLSDCELYHNQNGETMYQMSLVGMWLTNYYGVMEFEEISLAEDGTGWWYFVNLVVQELTLVQWEVVTPNTLRLTFGERKSSLPPEERGEDRLLNTSRDFHIEIETGHWDFLGYPEPHPIMTIAPWITCSKIEFSFSPRQGHKPPTITEESP